MNNGVQTTAGEARLGWCEVGEEPALGVRVCSACGWGGVYSVVCQSKAKGGDGWESRVGILEEKRDSVMYRTCHEPMLVSLWAYHAKSVGATRALEADDDVLVS